MPIRIAGQEVSLDEALRILGGYPAKTLREYDGRALDAPEAWRKFTEEDVTAVRVIERRAVHDPVAQAILAADLPWEEVPDREVDLADQDETSQDYEQLAQFFRVLDRLPGVGSAVATKFMYLKWPAATIIQDSLLMDMYADPAHAKYLKLREQGRLPAVAEEAGWTHLYALAVRDDLLANHESGALDELRSGIGMDVDEERAAVLSRVSDVRLLDILTWSLAQRS